MKTGIGLARACLLGAIVAVSGCKQLGIGYTPIRDIVMSPGMYEGQEVRVRGIARATMSVPFLELRSFVLEEEGVQLLVLTDAVLPAEGENIALRGVVHSTAILEGRALGLRIREIERL